MEKKLNRREFLKEMAQIGGAIGAGMLGGFAASRLLSDTDKRLQELRTELQKEQLKNSIGDCVNENILRQALGAPPVDLEQCLREREQWEKDLTEPEGNDL